jgi:hypothetical protein
MSAGVQFFSITIDAREEDPCVDFKLGVRDELEKA